MEEFVVIISHVALKLNILNVKTGLYNDGKTHHLKLSVIKRILQF